jgi:cytochrome c556
MPTHFVSKFCALALGSLIAIGAVAAENAAPGPGAAAGPGAMPSPAERAIAYRKAVYTVLGGNFGPIGGTLQGRMPYNAKEIGMRADRVAFIATLVPDAFPEVSKDGATKAKPEIWTDKAGFDKAVTMLLDSTAALAAQVKKEPDNVDGFKAAAGKVGQACKNCHDNYRAK